MRTTARAALLAAVAFAAPAVGLAACGSSGSSDPATAGPAKQAVEKLRDYGLTTTQARCVVDRVGAQTVVEASDLNAFTDSQPYRDAAKVCIGDG